MAGKNKRSGSNNVRKAGSPKRSRIGVKVFRSKKSKGKINATQKVVDGIKFKSMLEVFTYRKLKEFGLRFEYEMRSFTIMEGFKYPEESWENRATQGFENKSLASVRGITYTPDFIGYDENGKMNWVIECKGFANDRFPNTWKMFKKTLIELDSVVPLYLPKNQKQVLESIQMILDRVHPV